jgi:DNA-binding MarR family transcriptional regulator
MSSDRTGIAVRLHSATIHLLRSLAREDVALETSAARLSALSVLVFGGQRTIGGLAEAERVTPPTMTRLVAAMERDGLVSRQAVAGDRRAVMIQPTAAGRALLLRGRDRRVQALRERLATLTRDEVETVAAATALIERMLRDDARTEPG